MWIETPTENYITKNIQLRHASFHILTGFANQGIKIAEIYDIILRLLELYSKLLYNLQNKEWIKKSLRWKFTIIRKIAK